MGSSEDGMTTPMSYADSLRVGAVHFVSPDKIEALLDGDAPGSTALNAGTPQLFPRVNGYVLIPSETGFAVGQVEWITIERAPYPQGRQTRDPRLIDVPFPFRRMSVALVGTLSGHREVDSHNVYSFRRGLESLPTVGDPVLLPTSAQLRYIVESGERRRVWIGTSPLAANARVMVDPDRLFGRHLAVLGNTGSGKSCSVAGLIRWSYASARNVPERADNSRPNSRFIIFDPNGEYSQTFSDLKGRVLSVDPSGEEGQLRVPMWLWNVEEWAAFTQATPRTQKPTLIHALRALRDGRLAEGANSVVATRQFLRTFYSIVQVELRAGTPWGPFPKNKSFFNKLKKLQGDFTPCEEFSAEQSRTIRALSDKVQSLVKVRDGGHDFDFSRTEVEELLGVAEAAYRSFAGAHTDSVALDADTPIPFEDDHFLRSLEAHAELLNVSEYVETLLMRARTLVADRKLRPVISCGSDETLTSWLESIFGTEGDGCLTVIDLSLLPSEMIHVITSVLARMILEALQRYRRENDGETLPTVLVMEEAHTFIKRYNPDPEIRSAQEICTRTFEKIAREGRKFGLGLVLSSQRPSELSTTVLSQCNSFLLHRLTNHTDQDLVHRLVPDNMKGLLRDIPSLPSRNAVLLGWAAELPVSVEMRYLPSGQQPRSDDPDFWDVWAGVDPHGQIIRRSSDWSTVAENWQNHNSQSGTGGPIQADDESEDPDDRYDPL